MIAHLEIVKDFKKRRDSTNNIISDTQEFVDYDTIVENVR